MAVSVPTTTGSRNPPLSIVGSAWPDTVALQTAHKSLVAVVPAVYASLAVMKTAKAKRIHPANRKRAESPEIVDFDEKQCRRDFAAIIRTADKRGFVGLAENGKRFAYLVSPKFWRTDVLDSDKFVKITRRGKTIACLMPMDFWDFLMSFLGSFTPAARRKLPDIARSAALREARDFKRSKTKGRA